MKRVFALVIVLALLMVGVMPTLAQDIDVPDIDLPNTYDWPIGASVDYPDNWESILDDEEYMHLRSEETDLVFGFFFFEEEEDTLEAFIQESFEGTRFDTSVDFDEDNFLYGDLPNASIAAYSYTETYEGSSYERTFFAVPLDDETAVVATAIPLFDDAISEYEDIFAILNSLRMREDVDSTESGSSESGGLGGILGGGSGGGSAQQEEGTFTWSFDVEGGIVDVTVEFSDMWEITVDDSDAEHLRSENTDIVFSFYTDEERSMEELIEQNFENTRIDESIDFDPEELIVGNFPELSNFDEAVAYQYLENFDGDRYNRIFIAVQPHPQVVVTAAAIPLAGRDIEELDEILEVVNSITADGGDDSSGTSSDSSGKR